jgi:hypothetical protein
VTKEIAPALRKRSEIRRTRIAPESASDAWCLPEGLEAFAATGDELLAMADEIPAAIIEGIAGERDVLLLAGEEKRGLKTWLALDLAICRVAGAKWLGHAVEPCASEHVLIVSPETHVSVIARRLRALCVGRGLEPRDVLPRIHVAGERVSAIPLDEIESTWRTAGLRTVVDAMRTHDAQRRDRLAAAARDVADAARAGLGPGIVRWRALLDSPPGTWGLIIIDTLRTALSGDENSSRDAARYSQACRDLSRRLGCPSVHVHHTGKAAQGGARSARGSTELTAGVDGILSIDVSGERPTMTFTLRGFVAPEPVGYELVDVAGGGIRIETREPSSAPARRRGASLDESEVLHALEYFSHTALTVSALRKNIAQLRGAAPGSKVSHDAVVTALAALERKGKACRTTITTRAGSGPGKSFPGWQLGSTPGSAEAEHIDLQGGEEQDE